MDNDLNRATATRVCRLLALYVGTCVGGACLDGISRAEETRSLAGVPYRITAPAASAHNAPQTGASTDRAATLFIREPSSDEEQPFLSIQEPTFSTWTEESPWQPATPQKRVAIPTQVAPSNRQTDVQSEALPPKIDTASVMTIFGAAPPRIAQTAASREKASRQDVFSTVSESRSTLRSESQSSWILPGFSYGSLRQSAAKSLDEAAIGLSHRASLSGAAAATDSLRKVAQAIDIQRGDNCASINLAAALTAMSEAEDFVGRYGTVDAAAITRMVRSHETTALKKFDTVNLTGIGAADVYMDYARQQFAAIAVADPLAAHAVGLLAKSYRQRAAESPIALAASVHLMRAAASAVPSDRGLVTELVSVLEQANLHEESRVVLAHVHRLPAETNIAGFNADTSAEVTVTSGSRSGDESNVTRHALRVEQITPEAFAGISRSEAGPVGNPTMPSPLVYGNASPPKTEPAPVVSTQAMYGKAGNASDNLVPEAKEGNVYSRAVKSVSRMWR